MQIDIRNISKDNMVRLAEVGYKLDLSDIIEKLHFVSHDCENERYCRYLILNDKPILSLIQTESNTLSITGIGGFALCLYQKKGLYPMNHLGIVDELNKLGFAKYE